MKVKKPVSIYLYLNKRTWWFIDMFICIGSKSSTEKGWSQVDSDGGKPYHKQTKSNTLWVVFHHLKCLQIGFLLVNISNQEILFTFPGLKLVNKIYRSQPRVMKGGVQHVISSIFIFLSIITIATLQDR